MSKYNDVYVKFKKIHCIYNKIYGSGYELKKVSNKPEEGFFDKLPVELVTYEFETQKWQINEKGGIHGGAIAGMFDTAFGVVANFTAGENEVF